MKIRIIIITLSLLSMLIILIGGYRYYTTIRDDTISDRHVKLQLETELISDNFQHLESYMVSVELVSGFKEIRDALSAPGRLHPANTALDFINKTVRGSVSYLMDRNGNTIASSNRNDPDSFVGKNYSFRPYFRDAFKNKRAFYIALGITSNKLGIYLSHAVYTGKEDTPAGVVVLKLPFELVFDDIRKFEEGSMSIVDSNGLIILSNIKEMEYNFLWKHEQVALEALMKSRQFGRGPFPWAGFKRTGDKRASDVNGDVYYIHETAIKNFPGWKVIFLHNYKDLKNRIITPLLHTTGYMVLFFFIVIAAAVTFLYRMADHEIKLRMKAEEELNASLDEKGLLIREIHHRVKNNLMVIESLLMLQMRAVKEGESRDHYIVSRNRVRSISLMHEKLYRTDTASSLNINEYISSLAAEIVSNYRVNTDQVRVNINVSDIRLDVDLLIPCGLIINELISNAFKHAFPDGRKGELTINIERQADDMIILEVKDNGVGIPGGYDISTSKSLGMSIVNSLVLQIKGKLEINRDNGTVIRIIFKEKPYKKKTP